MKKKIFIFSSALILSVGAIYATCKYTTSCGSQFVGAGPVYFETAADHGHWVMEMNDILCGEAGAVDYACQY